MNISQKTIDEVRAVSEANREHAERLERDAAALQAFSERIAEDAIYLHACGFPLGQAIAGAARLALEDARVDLNG